MEAKSKAERATEKGRTFQQRLDDEMQNFQVIYKQISASIEVPESRNEDTIVPSEWARAFDIDIEALRSRTMPNGDVQQPQEVAKKSAYSKGRRKSLEERFHRPREFTSDAVRSVIKNYDFGRPRRALNMNKIPAEIRMVEGFLETEPPSDAWLPFDRDDPVFWRTLLEIFCRTFDVENSTPEFWTKRKYFELACDAFFLRQALPKWSKAAAATHLAKTKPYSKNYVDQRANMAREERSKARGAAGIARRLAELEDWIGGFDVEGLRNLRDKDHHLFDDVFNRAVGVTWLDP
ncbi:MAG: hypothetical protein G4V63_29835 [Candidatus Afipia apatlaquensis]|uniref:Uncharacterized protein n=1 Tax=Candidatus Afipia apatlaquensis TaxID=2712852 RepID=A0A7C9VJ72_9BRAD|nr:hypothetical protein [Candidatus Afipia apatlaquensis]